MYFKDLYINEIYKRIYYKYKISKNLIINFLFIIIFSLILKNFINIEHTKIDIIEKNNKTNIFNINYIIIKNNTFINQFENKNNKYIFRNNIKNKSIIDKLDNLNIKHYIYSLIYRKNNINNYINFFNNTEKINNKEKINSFNSTKTESLKENEETLSFN